MDMFKWVGRKKREEEWMRQPRRVPSYAESLPDDTTQWMMTQEFVNDEDKNIRIYYAARQPDPKTDVWHILKVTYDLKRDGEVSTSTQEVLGDALDVVKTLRDWERAMRANNTYILHEGARPTYLAFANKHGIHFDENGAVFKVEQKEALTKGTFMSRESLDKLFHKEAAKRQPLESFDALREELAEKWPAEWVVKEEFFREMPKDNPAASLAPVQPVAENWEPPKPKPPAPAPVAPKPEAQPQGPLLIPGPLAPTIVPPVPVPAPVAVEGAAQPPAPQPAPVPVAPVFNNYAGYPMLQKVIIARPITLADLAGDPAYAEYAHHAAQMHKELRALPALLNDTTQNRYAKEGTVTNLLRARRDTPAKFTTGDTGKLAGQLLNLSLLMGVLRAGVDLYHEEFGKGRLSPDGLQMISRLGDACAEFAREKFGVDEAEAKKISAIITQGRDPDDNSFPLENVFASFKPAAYKPPAAKPAQPPKRSGGNWWD
jgi:hypothetical protein